MAGLKVSVLGPKIAQYWGGFAPEICWGGTYKHPYRMSKLFQDTSRRVAKFRENRPRDVEKWTELNGAIAIDLHGHFSYLQVLTSAQQ